MEGASDETDPAAGTPDLIAEMLLANDVEGARRAAAPLLRTSIAAQLAKEPRLTAALDRWWVRAGEVNEPCRLEWLALLWRLTSLSAMNMHRQRLSSAMRRGFVPSLRPLSTLTDPKDRRAVAEALLVAPTAEWLKVYAAEAIVADPDPKSDARDAMCALILRQTADVGRTFALLDEQFESLKLNQQDPGAGRARRLAWILRSLRVPLHEDEIAVAEPSFGLQFDRFARHGVGYRKTNDHAAFVDAARETLLTVNSVVRLHGLTLATEAITYTVVSSLRRAFEATEWPEPLRDPVQRLSVRVVEALIVLARQGIADAGLRRVLALLLGESSAGNRLRRAVEASEGISSEVTYWLETGQLRERLETAGAIEETATSLVDLELARALIEAFRADEAIENGLSPEEPLRRLAREMREAARKRGIFLRGSPGEVVDLSPLDHEVDASIMGYRRVILVTPIAERVAGNRKLGVLVKAQVKPLKEV